MKINKSAVLKKYIRDKYGSVHKFSKKEKFPQTDLEIMFDKKDVFHEIGIGVKMCGFLNIDAGRLFCKNEIAAAQNSRNNGANANFTKLSLDDTIKEKYARLDADKRKKILEYANYIFENGGL